MLSIYKLFHELSFHIICYQTSSRIYLLSDPSTFWNVRFFILCDDSGKWGDMIKIRVKIQNIWSK